METKITPFGNNILVKPQKPDTILQSTEGNLCEYGEVIDVGEDVIRVKIGDTIGFTKWGVKHIEIKNEKHYFIPEDARFILGKFSMLR